MENREKAKREYLSGKSLKDIADELGVKDSTVRAWKLRDGWPKVQRKIATKNKSAATVKQTETIEPLNDKQQLFCELYVTNFNATQSYMKVYNCEYNTASTEGSKALANPKIRAYIKQLKDIKRQAILADENDIVEMYMKIAFSNLNDYVDYGYKDQVVAYTKDGEPIIDEANYMNLKESNRVDGSIVSEIRVGKQGTSVRLHDKMKALEWLSNYFEINPEFKHRREQDYNKLQLERERFEHNKELDERELF